MTPRAINSGELASLRSGGQWSKLTIIIDVPNTIYTARATGAVNKTAYTLGFDGGSGTLSDCLADMTILVGSAAGGYDKGIGRLRKAPIAGTFYLGADPSLVVADNDYLTVINDFVLFAKHPFGSLLDVDVAYSDQFASFIPVAVVDGGRVAVIDAGGTASFDASNSWVPGSTISAYAWTFTGATSSTNTNTATPTATYNTSGRYRWDLTLTAANTKTAVFHGWVYVLGTNLSADTALTFSSISGDDDGWNTSIIMYDRPTIKNGARVVIIAEDYYANEQENLGPVTGRKNIIMVGWILGETIVRDPKKDIVEFQISGPLAALSQIASHPAGLVNTSFPEDSAATLPAWAKMASMTAAKGLHYLINYRSNAAKVIDVLVEDWLYAVHKLTGDGDNLLAHLDDFASNAALNVRADRFGVVYIQRDGQLYPVDDRTANIPAVMTLTDADWWEEKAIVRRQVGGTAMAEAEGYIFSGGTLTNVGGRSPGDQPARWGDKLNIDNLNVTTQGDVLELSGLLAGSHNGEYESIMAILSANNRFIDVTPRQFVTVTVDGDTLRCFPRQVTYRNLEGTGFWFTEIELEPEGSEWDAVAIDYPGEGDEPVDEPTEPPEPPEPPTEPPVDEEEPSGTDAVVATGTYIQTTADLDQASPTWTTEL